MSWLFRVLTQPADHIGWRLEAQTNDLSVGLSANWTSLGCYTTNSVSVLIASGTSSVFYRLAYP